MDPYDYLVLALRASDSWGSKVGVTTHTQEASVAFSLESAWQSSLHEGLCRTPGFWRAPWGQHAWHHCLPSSGNERKLQKKVCRLDIAVSGMHHLHGHCCLTVCSQHQGLFQPCFLDCLPQKGKGKSYTCGNCYYTFGRSTHLILSLRLFSCLGVVSLGSNLS